MMDEAQMSKRSRKCVMFTVPSIDLQTGARCASLPKRRLALSGITVFTPGTKPLLTPYLLEPQENHRSDWNHSNTDLRLDDASPSLLELPWPLKM